MSGVIWKAKATSLKLGVWPEAVVKPLIGKASRHPSRPPARARITDSTTNEKRMLRREKPIARSVPISRVRAATIAYIVLSAPKTAPSPMMIDTKATRNSSVPARPPDWSSEVLLPRHRPELHLGAAANQPVEALHRRGALRAQPGRFGAPCRRN